MQKPTKRLPPKIWKRDELLLFLDIFEDTFHASVKTPFNSESAMWNCVSERLLSEGGYTASAQHCQSKWNFLYKTYAANKNQQGAFYAKIRQIVEYSQQVNSKSEAKSNDEAIQDTSEQIVELGHEPEKEIQIEAETVEILEDCEPTVALEYSSPKVEKSHDIVQEPRKQPNEEQQQPVKRLKVKHEVAEIDEESQPEKPPPEVEEPQRLEHPESNQVELTQPTASSLNSVLQSILTKIDSIHQEQLSQGRRLEWMERLQLENRQTLLEIKNHLKLK